MENEHVKLIIKKIRETVSKPMLKKLDLDKCERVVEKLYSFTDCEECQHLFHELTNHLNQLESNVDKIADHECKQLKQFIEHTVSHLQKKHKFVAEGHYLAIYMSIGMSFGLVFGLTLFDNIAMGLPLGMGIGIAIGASLDADAKNKGKTI
ncbi:hypothetical protein [Cytobacillus luteolus]|nr:hypothetical protein [Cytobacillus luteolus]MBP1941208.1 hypothetical protein [Cytobacillus luteolus]